MALDEEYDILYSSGTTASPRASFTAISRVIFLFLGLKRWSLRVVSYLPVHLCTQTPQSRPGGPRFGWVQPRSSCESSTRSARTSYSRLRDHARHVGACAVPTHVGFPNHSPDNWKSVKWLFSTSAPLSAVMKEKILKDTSAQLLEFYGLTEGGVATTLVAGKPQSWVSWVR